MTGRAIVTSAANFSEQFDDATGLPHDVAEYVRLRVVLRLGGYRHAEVDEIMGTEFSTRPDDWRLRFELANAEVGFDA